MIKSNIDKFVEKSKEIHNNFYCYDKFIYINSITKGIIICPIHGEFLMNSHDHLGKHGCYECGKKKKYKLTFEDIKNKGNVIHNFKYIYIESSIKNVYDKISIICPNHGMFEQKINDHINCKSGCPSCSNYKSENTIEEYLNFFGILYEKQKKFSNCINPQTKRKLPFDFYLNEYNICIEYDGIQHFKSTNFGGNISSQKQKENLKYIKTHDKIKNNFCDLNKIKLLRIPYTKKHKIKEIIVNKILKPNLVLILDVDGVLSENKIYDENGKTIGKSFNDKDFTAIKIFKSLSIPVIWLSGDDFNKTIAKKRSIMFIHSKNRKNMIDKVFFIKKLEKLFSLSKDKFIYCGDDIFDIPFIKKVGYSFCPSDAPDEVKKNTKFILKTAGGKGIVPKIYETLVNLDIIKNNVNIAKLTKIDAQEHFRTM